MSNEKFNNILCYRIKNLRQKSNLTIEQLAYQSGLSKGGLSEIERGKKSPMPLTILKICTALGITMKDFFDYEEINEFQNLL